MKTLPRRIAALCVALASTTMAWATPFLWNGSGGNMDWSVSGNWLPPGQPGVADSVTFGTTGQSGAEGSADNVVDQNFTIDSLWYAATNISPTFMYHNTQINAGVTLTVDNANAAIVLDSGTQTDPTVTPPGKTASYSSIFGAGSLAVNDTNTASVMIVSQGSSTYSGASGLWALLDMSQLNSFTGTFGRLLIGVQGATVTNGQVNLVGSGRQSGQLFLGVTNSIHLTQTGDIQGTGSAAVAGPALVINDSPFFGDNGSMLYLGQSNAIWADTITVGRIQCSRTALFEFNPNASFGANQQLYLRGESSNRVSEVVVGDNTANGGNCNAPPGSGIVVPPGGFQVGAAGLFDVSAGSSDMMMDTLIVGKGFNGGGGGYAAGIFNMGAGTLDVNTVQLGVMSSASETAPTEGTLNISGGGTVRVNSGSVALGVIQGAPGATYAQGTLTINNGTLNVANGAFGINDGGLINSAVDLTNATVTAANIGSVSAPIGTLILADSTLNLTVSGLQGAVVANHLIRASTSVGNTINVTSIAGFVGSQPVVTLIQAENTISNTATFTGGANGSDFVLGTLPAGYQGHLQVTATAVQLVITQTPVALDDWTGADIASHNTNWSDAHNWSSSAEPDANDAAFFVTTGSVGSSALSKAGGGPGAIVGSAINNIVDGDVSALGLNYLNTGGSFQNTYISNGLTLTLGAGGLTVGSANVDEGNTTGNATISGAGGTLSVNNSGAVIYVGLGHASAGSTADATLDMSGLGTFNANAGSFLVGVGAVGYTTVLQPAGTVYMAQSNNITATAGNGSSDSSLVALDIGDAGDAETSAGYGKSVSSALYLGETNTIWSDYIDVGRQFASGGLFFNPSVTNGHPNVYIRGASGGAVAVWNIGDAAENALAAGGGAGVADFTGGSVNAWVNTLGIGISSPNSVTASSTETGTLTFDAGTITAGTVNVSENPASGGGSYYSAGNGTLNVNGTGTLVVSGSLNLGLTPGTQAGGTPQATLNINGGTVLANTLTAGGNGAVTTININGGTLAATNGIGTALAPLSHLNVTNGTIAEGAANAPFINIGSLTLSGANSLNILAMPSIETYPATITVLQSATPIVGAVNFTVQAPNGYAGVQLAESGDQKSLLLTVQSGPVTGRGIVYWVGPTGGNMNWSDAANWFIPPRPAAPDTAFFDNIGQSGDTTTPDNVVDSSGTIAALWYAATNANGTPLYHNTVINSGVTLTVSNNGPDIIFDTGTQTDPSAGTTCSYDTISGSGALDVVDTNSESVMIVSQGSSTYFYPSGGLWASMDMSSLNSFQGTFGRLLVGVQGVGATAGEVALNGSGRQTGRLSLALTNVIHLTQPGNNQGGGSAAAGGPAMVVLDSGFFGDNGSIVTLGQSNALWADSITIGRNGALQSGVLQFNPAISGPQQFFLRGESSNRVSEFIVADGTFNGNSSQYEAPDSRINVTPTLTGGLNVGESAIVDVSEGSSDMMVDTLILGKGFNAFGGGYAVGQLNMGAGTLNVNSLQMGVISATNATGAPVTGILNLTGGTVTVNGELALGVPDSAGTVALADGDLNVTNGVVQAAAITAGGSPNSEITLSAGTLSLTSPGTIGTVAAPVGSITLVGGATLNLAVGSFPAVVATTLVGSGTSDTIHITSLPAISTVPSTNVLIRAASGTIGSYDFTLGGSLPTGYTGHIQKSADSTSVDLVITAAPAPPSGGVKITSALLESGDLVISGTNGVANANYTVLTSTNLSAPAGFRWTPLSSGAFNASGAFQVSIPLTNQQQFFEIKSQ